MAAQSITLWGAANLRSFSTPLDQKGREFPFASKRQLKNDPMRQLNFDPLVI